MATSRSGASTLGQQAGKFVRHVVPAAFKPIHSLWHEILSFLFLAIAAGIIWRLVRSPGRLSLPVLLVVIFFLVILIFYGVSSFLKSRRITRS
jgi:hypothetical protein